MHSTTALLAVELLVLLSKGSACPRPCTCGYYAKVHSLDCSSQDLIAFPKNIPEWTTYVRLDGNNLEVLDLNFCKTCQYFEKFSLRFNQIHTIIANTRNSSNLPARGNLVCPETAVLFPRVVEVNLRGNRLRKLPKCLLFVWPALKILNLNENRIKRWRHLNLEGTYAHTNSVEELRLRGNQLSELLKKDLYSGTLALNRLKYLDISTNRIHTIESGVFTFMDELQRINLAENKLGYLPDFAFVTRGMKITKLLLAGNYIDWISPRAFAGLPNLVELDLRRNEITCMSSTILSTCQPLFAAPDITTLNQQSAHLLADQSVRHFHRKFKIDYSSLRVVGTAGNQWMCDCKLKKFLLAENGALFRLFSPRTMQCSNNAHQDLRIVLKFLVCDYFH